MGRGRVAAALFRKGDRMADNTKVGGLEIEIAASADNAVTALDRLASTLERLDGQSGKSGQSLEALSAKLKNLANTPGFSNLVGDVERIQAAGTSAAAGVEKLSAATAKASNGANMAKLQKELARVEAQAERDGNALLKLQEQLEGMKAFEGNGGVSNEEVISVIFAAAQQIVRAINDKDTSVMMDGRNVTSRVTDMQNRNNRIYGKTIQNI